MIAYVGTEDFVRPVVFTGNLDDSEDMKIIREANPHEPEVLAVEEGGQRQLDMFRHFFKEFHRHEDWYFFVPTIHKFVKEVAGA